jgi:hypothetical protein
MPRLSSATDTWHPSNSAVYTNDVDSSVVLVTPVRSGVFRHYRPCSLGGRLFRLGVDTALAPCNHSLTIIYVDVSMRSHRVKKQGKLLTNQTTVIVDITIRKTKLVRAAEHRRAARALQLLREMILDNKYIVGLHTRNCYALLRMRPLSISCAECSVVISCGKVDYDKSGWRDD